MRKLLVSLMIIGAVGGTALWATNAFFSDTETSSGNTFTAGSLDLTVDYAGYYNKAVDSEPNAGSWTLTDLTSEKFFYLTDIKPGDYGEGTISLHLNDNDAWGCVTITPTANDDVSSTEPELTAGDSANTSSLTDGELAQNLQFRVWADTCSVDGATPGDNIYQTGCDTLLTQGSGPLSPVTWALADSTHPNVFSGSGALAGNATYFLGVDWTLPNTVGNEVQSDTYTADISFRTEQERNNSSFLCNPPITINRTQTGFGDGGWAGWSCPAGTTAIGGGIDSSTNPVGGHGVAAPSASAVDTYTYPTYPHYTFGSGETGYVVHDLVDGSGNTISFHVDCLPD